MDQPIEIVGSRKGELPPVVLTRTSPLSMDHEHAGRLHSLSQVLLSIAVRFWADLYRLTLLRSSPHPNRVIPLLLPHQPPIIRFFCTPPITIGTPPRILDWRSYRYSKLRKISFSCSVPSRTLASMTLALRQESKCLYYSRAQDPCATTFDDRTSIPSRLSYKAKALTSALRLFSPLFGRSILDYSQKESSSN